MKYLFIAEKPSSMREFMSVYKTHTTEITRAVGGNIDFIALRGHIFRNQQPKEYPDWNKTFRELYLDLPMIPETWKIAPIKNAGEVIKALKEKLKEGYDGIIVGTDSDVEGYGIYYMVATALSLKSYPTLRFYETALTEKDILNSFLSMEDLYKTPRHRNALAAYVFRSRWDWMIGMNLTTAYTVRYGQLMRVGSVKAPTLKLIYDNCNAIDHFVENVSYGVKSTFSEGYSGHLLNDEKKEAVFEKKEDAATICSALSKQGMVISYATQKKTQKAPKLYALSDLQVEAAKAPYGYTPDQTLKIVQELYEAKILSYPRTSGNYLASGKVPELPGIINSLHSIPELVPFLTGIAPADYTRVAGDKNIINDAEVAKAAHDALIPTGQSFDWSKLSEAQKNVLLLVSKRLVAHFLPCFSEEKTTMIVDNVGQLFQCSGRKTIQNGFYDLYQKTITDVIIPTHAKGDIVGIDKSEVYEKKTAPPKRYTTGSIIDAMKGIAKQISDPDLKKLMKESEGIGTEATRANILSELQESGYIQTRKNAIYITPEGKSYIENLRRETENGVEFGIADPVKVAYWSAKAKELQLGTTNIKDVFAEFEAYLNQVIQDIKESGEPVRNYSSANTEDLPPCPCCGEKILSGKYGYYCSGRNNGCKFSIPNEIASKKLSDAAKKRLLEGRTVQGKGFVSKSGKTFDAGLKLNKEIGKLEFVFPKKD